jgi:hypothetical protein
LERVSGHHRDRVRPVKPAARKSPEPKAKSSGPAAASEDRI